MSKGWDKEFDASVGLMFSLRAFETYRKSGTLSAEIRSVPGIRGHCQAYLELAQGKVVSCYLIDRQGDRHTPGKELLMRLDEEKGPFNWVFRENTEQVFAEPVVQASISRTPVLRALTHSLDVRQLQQWTPQQQLYLYQIFMLVNGQRSVDEIKAQAPFPPAIVDEGLRILLQLGFIAV